MPQPYAWLGAAEGVNVNVVIDIKANKTVKERKSK